MTILTPQLPIYDGRYPNFAKVSELFDINTSSLSKILACDPATIRRKPTENVLRKAQPLFYVLNMLWKLTEGNADEIIRWLHEPRIEFSGLSPLNIMEIGNIETIKSLLESEISDYGEISS